MRIARAPHRNNAIPWTVLRWGRIGDLGVIQEITGYGDAACSGIGDGLANYYIAIACLEPA